MLVATDLDSGDAAPFGQPGLDAVPISQALQAITALPGLFPPVEIGGKFYVDGALKKTLHARVLLDQGVDLMICLNPLVPFDASAGGAHRLMASGSARIPRMVDGGLPATSAAIPRSTSCCSSPTSETPRCSSPTPSASRAGARWPSMRTSTRARCCARAARRSRRSSRATASASTTRCSTMRSATCSKPALAVQRLDEVLDDLERALQT